MIHGHDEPCEIKLMGGPLDGGFIVVEPGQRELIVPMPMPIDMLELSVYEPHEIGLRAKFGRYSPQSLKLAILGEWHWSELAHSL